MNHALSPVRFGPFVFLVIVSPWLGAAAAFADDAWTFVSWPDFTNIDLAYPEPNWEDALDFMLDGVAAERPDFTLVAGDLLMGRWWEGQEQIERLSAIYYLTGPGP